MSRVLIAVVAIAGLLIAALASASQSQGELNPAVDLSAIPQGEPVDFGPPPAVPDGPLPAEVSDALGALTPALAAGQDPSPLLQTVVATGDARLAWPLADIFQFVPLINPDARPLFENALTELTGVPNDPFRPWSNLVDHLLAWDTPAPPEYFAFKRGFYSSLDPRWGELFSDTNTIDWRLVGWGGVFIDDRPAGSTDPCNCIPALDDPVVTPAADGDWYPDDAIVFGVVVNGEARAYPKNIMEVHEMVNDTLGGRRIAMPYCTLCGSAQAYFTDELGAEFGQPVFRTSGLLSRSNKMMYDLTTKSFIDTFTGQANAGPLAAADITFPQVSVVTATWAEWRAAHPTTTIIASDGGLGRSYDLDPLGGRDDDGPIFPVGAVDTRLTIQDQVLGVRTRQGDPIAFHVATAREILAAGDRIEIDGIRLRLDGDGIRAEWIDDGTDASGHQAFWFAWSQFWPRTALWPHDFQA